jgi:predicted site-specific integrase-resolvase
MIRGKHRTRKEAETPVFLDIKKAAAEIPGLSVYRVRQWIKDGSLKFEPFGNKHMILRSNLIARAKRSSE